MNTLQKILFLLEQSNMSDQEFIKKIGAKDKNLVFNWRTEVTKSYSKYINEIALCFNVSTDYLLGKTDNPAPLDKQLEGEAFALWGEVKDLSEAQKADVMKFIKFVKSQEGGEKK